MRRDIAIVRSDLWDKRAQAGKTKWQRAEERLRELGESGYVVVSVIPVANAGERGDVVWTLERTESGTGAYR